MAAYGYGKVLDIDLSAGTIIKRDIDPEFARDYVGGMGFGCKILYDEVGPGVDPLSPQNMLIFSNGPLTGTGAPYGGRTEVTTRSPLTNNIGTGNTGGLWGAMLKHAGYDLILIRNRAEKPVYLWINDDSVEIRDASQFWGKDIPTTSDAIRKELDPALRARISVLAIGPAGENLVRFACPVNDYHHVAGRCGAGAVMGAKKLKAIAVRGTGMVKVARPEEFGKAAREARERAIAADKARRGPQASSEARKASLERGCLPGKNFQTGILPDWIETRGLEVAMKYFNKDEGACYACPTSCFKLMEVKDGKYIGVKVTRGQMPGVVFCFGAKCALDNLPAIWKCKELCQHLGMDYASACGSIAFAMELFQRGIINMEATGGLKLEWGNEYATIEMLQRIALREGFGDVLAEGSQRAAGIIGKGAERYVMATKGSEIMSNDPRADRRGWSFGLLTNPKGGDNVKDTHFLAEVYNPAWWVDKFDIFEEIKQKIYGMSPEEISFTWEGKALMCKWFEDLYSALNALGLCFFPAGFSMAIGPTHLAKLYSACTGQDTTPQDIMKMGEKVFTLLKAYTMQQGLSRKDDTFPDRFFEEPLPEGPAKEAKLSRDEINKLLDEYYELRGWDKRTGLPTREKFLELGLNDIPRELGKLGKLPG